MVVEKSPNNKFMEWERLWCMTRVAWIKGENHEFGVDAHKWEGGTSLCL
jgi:hypothetical protein